jgi:hypothetical protein
MTIKNRIKLRYMGAASLLLMGNAHAGWFSANEGKTFETRGAAVVMSTGSFSAGIEKRDVPIPRYIDVTTSSSFNGMTHDSESGWTKCRVPLKGGIGWDGVKDKQMVFDCKPLTYFK